MERFSESEKAELWDRFEAGESLRAISRGWVVLRHRFGPISWLPGGDARSLLGIGVRYGCRSRSVRRSRVG